MTPRQICEKFGISSVVLERTVNYIQGKLKAGDTAYTPLVNDYYPALGAPGNITGTNGAPTEEEMDTLKIVEGDLKYKKVKDRAVVAAPSTPEVPAA